MIFLLLLAQAEALGKNEVVKHLFKLETDKPKVTATIYSSCFISRFLSGQTAFT